MPELRVTLMVVGGIFLIALAWWELRRSRQVRGSELARPALEPAGPERASERASEWDLPPLDLPRMSARDPEAELPIVELGAADFAALEAHAETTAPLPVSDESPPPDATDGVDGLLDELGGNQAADPPISDEPWDAPAVAATPEPEPAPFVTTVSAAAVPTGPVMVEWPAAQDSQVLAVRLVCTGEKFSGRAVRMALAAEGFVLGKFSIFHKPAPDGRALLSIASLNKPGTFDMHSIDLQRYGGLNLFTVLPGPVPGPAAVDELLVCAQVLSQRLRAALQDETGRPLSPARTAVMRNTAAAAPP
jgi:FtsZ-interacting cell division protein ZipA